MAWLNYHHLQYFWVVAKEGSIAAASRRLNVSQPTISSQIKQLESQMGVQLFSRVGRGLEMTDAGRIAHRYADEIFGLGRELVDALHDRPTGRPPRMTVGLAFVMPKLIAYRLLEPAMHVQGGMHIEVFEGPLDRLLSQLANHELDLVLSDVPMTSAVRVKAFNHPLGSSPVTFFAAPALAARLRHDFPRSLDGQPFLAPMPSASLRRELERWFETLDIAPEIVGQFDDSALVKVFGASGAGAFAAPSVIEKEVIDQFRVEVLGRTDQVMERFFAISVERRLKHPGVLAISQSAREELFN